MMSATSSALPCSSVNTAHDLVFGRQAQATSFKQDGTQVTQMELTVDQALQQGIAAHKAGKLRDAERLYRAILQAQPNHPDANHNLGVLAVAVGKPIEAIPLFKLALDANPQIEQFWLSYIDTLMSLARFDEAKRVLVEGEKSGVSADKLDALNQRLQGGEPNDTAKTTEGQTLSEKRKKLAEKKKSKKRTSQGSSLGAAPPQNQTNDLIEHYQAGRLEEAEVLATSLTQQFPRHPFGWKVLGAVLKQTGRLGASLMPMQSAVKLSPQDAEAHSNLGVTLKQLGRLDESEASYRQAIVLKPDYAEAHSNLGGMLREVGRVEEAEASCRRATALKPNYAEAHSNLGNALKELGRLDEAEASLRQAIALKPDLAEAHYNLGNTLKELGGLDEAEASYIQAIALKPDYAEAHSNLLMLIGSMLFNDVRYHESAAGFARAVDETVTSRFDNWSHSRDKESLRIGFVSGDLRSHPVGYFLEGLLIELQSSSIELVAYPTAKEADAVTSRLKPLFDRWCPLVGLNDMKAAQKIHSDGIHILFDLSGHTGKNRLPVFAWKPAPIQVSWLGYFASTGLSEMDYILGDPYVTAHEEADHFSETIWQLPETYLCFTPPDLDLKVAPLPACSNGFVTFGCFNKLSRMTDEIVSVRAAILHAVPGSKLFLKDKQLEHEAGRSRVLSRFAAVGIAADRLILEGRSPRDEYLECYGRVDIALSPFPYGGGTTSVEGLWAGVPVITKKGSHFLSHLGESIAHNSGLSDWIASDEEEYVAKAVSYASNLEALSELRNGMREQILGTPLFDVPRFALHFEQAVRAMKSRLDYARQ